MIHGTVRRREAVVLVVIQGAAGNGLSVQAVVDTGFDGDLVLPASVVQSLALEYRHEVTAAVGDNRLVRFAAFRARVQWLGAERGVLVLQSEGGPLLGMSLLQGSRLTVDVVEGGEVRIDPVVVQGEEPT